MFSILRVERRLHAGYHKEGIDMKFGVSSLTHTEAAAARAGENEGGAAGGKGRRQQQQQWGGGGGGEFLCCFILF